MNIYYNHTPRYVLVDETPTKIKSIEIANSWMGVN
jgi:hypothetical protein